MKLAQAGIFRATATKWNLHIKADQDAPLAVAVSYQITHRLIGGGEWEDWAEFEANHIVGYHYVIKSDGTVNQSGVDQLVAAFGWDGELDSIFGTSPPSSQVQLNVKEELYNGQVQVKVAWLNPGDYEPDSRGADEVQVRQLNGRFRSLLKAAASSAKGSAKKAAPKVTAMQEPPPHGDEDA